MKTFGSMSNSLRKVFLPENGFTVFIIAIGIAYGLTPLVAYLLIPEARYFGLLASITGLSVVAMWVGYRIPILDGRFSLKSIRLSVSAKFYSATVWTLFLLFIAITFSTATAIPILSALGGADSAEVSQQRGDFLKGRSGFAGVLVYLSTFMSTFIPYVIILSYQNQSKYRHLTVILFFIYSISFMAKAMFLFVAMPLIVYLSINNRISNRLLLYFFSSSILLLIGLTRLSLGGEITSETGGDFLTAMYAPPDPLSYFIWRSVGVPIFTAADTLLVHQEHFSGSFLMGATSSIISAAIGVERVNLERFVFEHQFGSWNDIANSNAVFVTDAFVNFGWGGVILFSIIVGQIFRWFKISKDVAFKAQWINFAFILFSASLVGALLSNWWVLLLAHATMIKIQNASQRN